MIKILQVLPTLNTCGGVENYLMNYYLHMDLSDFQIDFCVHSLKEECFKDLIEKKGGKVYVLPEFKMSNLKEIKRRIHNLFSEHHYDIVHCHQANGAYFYFKAAKKFGVRCRILHSHQTKAADVVSHAIRNVPLLFLGKRYATDYVACSKLAGDYLFKKNYRIIVNAVDTDKFSFSEESRAKVRLEFSIPDTAYVVGHVGRMCPQKNQKFLLDIFREINKKKNDAYLFLIGDGEDKTFLQDKVKLLGIQDRVIFTGSTTRTNEFYSAFDIFVLPSLYEGLPVVGVEAQCSGLPVLTSKEVTRELAITGNVKFLSLKDKPAIWANELLNFSSSDNRSKAGEKVADMGYDIKCAHKNLESMYKSVYEERYIKK